MNILLDSLPECVLIDGREWPVNWGYRAFILIELCMFDNKQNEEQKVLNALNIFYNRDIPDNAAEAINQMLWFYRGGKHEKDSADENKTKRTAQFARPKRCYDFDADAPYIYAAFRTQYGIDLQDTRNYDLHWWKFQAMFTSLDEDLKFSKIMYYRTVSTNGMSKQQRAYINEMKKLYALEDEDTADSRMKLAKRNFEMKEYVRNRIREVNSLGK